MKLMKHTWIGIALTAGMLLIPAWGFAQVQKSLPDVSITSADVVRDVAPASADDAVALRLVTLPSRVQESQLTSPSFPGGGDSLAAFLKRHLHYPEEARRQQREGVVRVSFVVNADGTIEDIRLRKDIGLGCGAEAVRVVSMMPRWQPCQTSDGRAVKVETLLPVRFTIDEKVPAGVNLDPARPEADEGEGLFVE
ncbi:MAG: energy transducer TonB [Bacteroidales bacterium]|nr:energy transducer TonB [Bacteroidales bacterium]